MRRFRCEPQEIEAVQWTGHNLSEVREFAGGRVMERGTRTGYRVFVRTRQYGDWSPVPQLFWIIRGRRDTDGPYHIVDPDFFAAVFEEYRMDDDVQDEPVPEAGPGKSDIDDGGVRPISQDAVAALLIDARFPEPMTVDRLRVGYTTTDSEGRLHHLAVEFVRGHDGDLEPRTLRDGEIPWD